MCCLLAAPGGWVSIQLAWLAAAVSIEHGSVLFGLTLWDRVCVSVEEGRESREGAMFQQQAHYWLLMLLRGLLLVLS